MASANRTAGSGTEPGYAGSGASTGSIAVASGASTGTFASSGASTGALPAVDGGAHTGDSGSVNAGLPCDVEQLLVTRCQSCHGSTPLPPSPMSLVTYADLMKPAIIAPSRSMAQESVIRMQGSTLPMPPAPMAPATPAEIAVLQNWINAGAPQGVCDVTPGDGGSSDAGAADGGAVACVSPVPPVVNTPVTCTSKMNWVGGNGAAMSPGRPCGFCHGSFAVAGTVYPTAHEKDYCYGVNGARGVTVVITDKSGMSFTLNPDNTGNFILRGTLTLPYQAKVVQAGKTRAMMTPQMSGDCNSCHSEPGYNCAPGRVLIP